MRKWIKIMSDIDKCHRDRVDVEGNIRKTSQKIPCWGEIWAKPDNDEGSGEEM